MNVLKKQKSENKINISPQVVAMWNPGGNNTAYITASLGMELSQHTNVFIAELPCLGIPRLCYEFEKINKDKNVDSLIVEYERQGEIKLISTEINKSLSILPADHVMPDYPTTDKIERTETLLDFPITLINKARQKGFSIIVFECQGQLTNPMTFQALKQADKVIIAIKTPTDLGWTKVNIKRLVETYNFDQKKFKVIGPNIDIISDFQKALEMKTYIEGQETVFTPEIVSLQNLFNIFDNKQLNYSEKKNRSKFSFLKNFKSKEEVKE